MRSSIVFATIMIIYFIFLIELAAYIVNVEINPILKSLIVMLYLILGIAILGYVGK